jgi:hypothetical protein
MFLWKILQALPGPTLGIKIFNLEPYETTELRHQLLLAMQTNFHISKNSYYEKLH